jgi:ParB-like chromosome segregation protein Spo0J
VNVLRLKMLRIDRLKLPGDFPKRVEAEKGRDRARSIGEHGLIRPAMVRQGTQEVIIGVDDIAALAGLGKEDVRCEIVECTDDEVKILRLEDALQSKHHTADERHSMKGELLILMEKQEKRRLVEERIRDPEGDGRHYSKLRAARASKERLAEKMGISMAAIHKAQARARKRLKAREEIEVPVPVKRFGMELTEAFEDRLVAARKGTQRLAGHIATCHRVLGEMRKAKLDLPAKQMERFEAMMDEAGNYIRNWTPIGLCPYCKGIPKLCPACPSCGGSAMYFKVQENGVLPELLNAKDPVVYVDGEFRPVGLFEEQAAEGVDVRLVEEIPSDTDSREFHIETTEGNGKTEPDPWGLGE